MLCCSKSLILILILLYWFICLSSFCTSGVKLGTFLLCVYRCMCVSVVFYVPLLLYTDAALFRVIASNCCSFMLFFFSYLDLHFRLYWVFFFLCVYFLSYYVGLLFPYTSLHAFMDMCLSIMVYVPLLLYKILCC